MTPSDEGVCSGKVSPRPCRECDCVGVLPLPLVSVGVVAGADMLTVLGPERVGATVDYAHGYKYSHWWEGPGDMAPFLAAPSHWLAPS